MEQSSDPPCAAVEAALLSRGWRFRDPEEIRTLIRTHDSLSSIEAELLNVDLRSIGGRSLPDPSALKNSPHLPGPKVLQVVSARDIYRSSTDAPPESSQRHRRLLRLVLTDGHVEVPAIEYTPIPSISQEIIPGTKVCLENKIPVHSGILCLNSKVVTVMGGLVQSLYEEWQMSQKYSGFSRSSLRISKNDDGDGPPPFEKFKVGARSQQSDPHGPLSANSDSRQLGREVVDRVRQSNDATTINMADDPKVGSLTARVEETPSTSEARPKEVSEAVPVQNQAAAQKLLQKMCQSGNEDRQPRGHKYRGKGKQEEAHVLTLDEWERQKGSQSNMKPAVVREVQDVSHDEELARQLQNQLDLEDFHGGMVHTEAEQIRMNMFSFSGAQEHMNQGRREFRGRGRGGEGDEAGDLDDSPIFNS